MPVTIWAAKKPWHILQQIILSRSSGLSDKYHGLRLFTLEKADEAKSYIVPTVLNVTEQMADKDPHKKVPAKALQILVNQNDKKYESLFTKCVNDSSYSVSRAALNGLINLEPSRAYTLVKKYSNNARRKSEIVSTKAIMANANEHDFNIIMENFKNSPVITKQNTHNFCICPLSRKGWK